MIISLKNQIKDGIQKSAEDPRNQAGLIGRVHACRISDVWENYPVW